MTTCKEKKKQAAVEITAMVKDIQGGNVSKKEDLARAVLTAIKPIVAKFYKSSHDRSEAANLIAARVIHKIDYIDITKPVLNYILYTANNYCIDEYRKKRRHHNKVVVMDNEALDLHPEIDRSSGLSYDEYIELYKVVTHGNEDYADIIYNLEQAGKTPEELSYLFRMDLETIKGIHKDALEGLKNIKRKLNSSVA